MVDRGDNTYGGKFVVNPSGGLISKGHPLGATGGCRGPVVGGGRGSHREEGVQLRVVRARVVSNCISGETGERVYGGASL